MANNGDRRVDSGSEYKEQYYIGNAVRNYEAKPQEEPERRSKNHKKSKKSSGMQHTAGPKARINKVGQGYVVFLAVVSAASVYACVQYLQVKAVITSQDKKIASLQSNLKDLKSDNDAYYNKVLASVDVEFIKNVAMNQLGMSYPDEDQVYIFDTDGDSYVRQYQNIPDAE